MILFSFSGARFGSWFALDKEIWRETTAATALLSERRM